jgi:cell division protein FtsQ
MNPSNRRIARAKLLRDVVEANPPSEVPPIPIEERPPRIVSKVERAFRTLAGFVLVIGISSSVAYGARRYVKTTPRFAVSEILVDGAKHRSESEIMGEAGIAMGTNIFGVDLDGARAKLLADPWIREATLARRLPGSIAVHVVEREAGAIVALGQSYLATREGEIFKPLEAGDPTDLTIITGLLPDAVDNDREAAARSIRRALDVALEYEHSPLASRAPLQEVHVAEDSAITLIVGKKAIALTLGQPPFRRKIEEASRVMTELEQRNAHADSIMLDNEARPERVVVRMR